VVVSANRGSVHRDAVLGTGNNLLSVVQNIALVAIPHILLVENHIGVQDCGTTEIGHSSVNQRS